jgi:uncharacterized protein YjbI with pentapeptide repeats
MMGLMVAALRFMRKTQAAVGALSKDMTINRQHQQTARLVAQLCDKNQLMRLHAIQQLGQLGQQDPLLLGRTAVILGAYLKALAADTDLRQTARQEITACFLEISALNTVAQARPSGLALSLDLEGTMLENLHLSDLNLSGLSMRGIRFVGCRLKHIDFSGAVLDEGLFQRCQMDTINFRHASLENLCFSSVEWKIISGIDEDILKMSSQPDKLRQMATASLMGLDDVPIDKSRLH